MESQAQPNYEWSGPNVKQLGLTRLVDEQEENRDRVYTCTLKNKAGSRTADFTLQDCRTGLLGNHSTQYLENLMYMLYAISSMVLFAGGVSPPVLFPVLIVTVLLIFLFAVVALNLYRRKKKKKNSVSAMKMYSNKNPTKII